MIVDPGQETFYTNKIIDNIFEPISRKDEDDRLFKFIEESPISVQADDPDSVIELAFNMAKVNFTIDPEHFKT